MEGYNNQLIRKDLIEEHWVEFLTFIKQKEADDRVKALERQKLVCERMMNGESEPEDSRLVTTTLDKVCESDYFSIDLYSFWRWYMKHKIEL